MEKSIELTPQQQRKFAQRMNQELDKITMSWDNDLRDWYNTAVHSLNFASAVSLQIPQQFFITLMEPEVQGLNMNVVNVLMECIARRTPVEMGVTAKDWAQTLIQNHRIAQRWVELRKPVENKLFKEFEIMSNRPSIVVGQA